MVLYAVKCVSGKACLPNKGNWQGVTRIVFDVGMTTCQSGAHLWHQLVTMGESCDVGNLARGKVSRDLQGWRIWMINWMNWTRRRWGKGSADMSRCRGHHVVKVGRLRPESNSEATARPHCTLHYHGLGLRCHVQPQYPLNGSHRALLHHPHSHSHSHSSLPYSDLRTTLGIHKHGLTINATTQHHEISGWMCYLIPELSHDFFHLTRPTVYRSIMVTMAISHTLYGTCSRYI